MSSAPGSTSSDRSTLPLVSVIIPAFNAEATLKTTLRSVAAQTYGHLEIVIVDDGSRDGTAAIGSNFCAEDPRARLIGSERNCGLSATRNRGIAETSGEWIAPIDADDLWHPTRVERMLDAALSATEPPGFVYCWHRLIDDQCKVIGSGQASALSGRVFDQLAGFNVVGNGSALLLRREAAASAGLYDESLREGCEDIMLQLSIARDWPIIAVPEYLVGWRIHDSNMSADLERMNRAHRSVRDRLSRFDSPVAAANFDKALARSALELSEKRAWKGDYQGASAKLLEAVRLDPARTSLYLAYRAARSVAKLLRRKRTPAQDLSFYEMGTTVPFESDPDELRVLARWIERFDQRSLKHASG